MKFKPAAGLTIAPEYDLIQNLPITITAWFKTWSFDGLVASF